MSCVLSIEITERSELVLCTRGIWAWIVVSLLSLIALFLFIYLLYKFIQGPNYTKKNRINGKVVIVTGCNTGIGKETALELARRGGRIYMACRDYNRCEEARLDIIERTGNQNVFNRTLDLSSLASVRQFAAQFLEEEPYLDILINNAGVLGMPHTLTVDGYEQTFAVNHLGHFLLTHLLLNALKKSAPSRIIFVSSIVYMVGSIKMDDLHSLKKYSRFGAYAQSKLANIMATRKFAEILKDTGVTVNSCHPGVVRTEVSRNLLWSDCTRTTSDFLARFWMKSARAGAQTQLRLALDPALEHSTGRYYSDSIPFPLLPCARDEKTIDWLWEESERLVGLEKGGENLNVNKSCAD